MKENDGWMRSCSEQPAHGLPLDLQHLVLGETAGQFVQTLGEPLSSPPAEQATLNDRPNHLVAL